MKKIGLLFPGQGSQYVGMGKDIYEKYAEAREIFNIANEVLGFDLKSVVFDGPEDLLKQTQYTQPAIFTTSVALFKVFTLHSLPFTLHNVTTAGHSLGEYSALCTAGFFDFNTGLRMVKARSEFIQQASEKNPGTMAAVIGLEKEILGNICKRVSEFGVCEMVNFNSPGQIVIAGTVSAVNKAVELANAAKAMKTVILNVSGAFHSSLMTEAANLMAKELEKHIFSSVNPISAVITNCDAIKNTDINEIKPKLARQINNPVLWEDTISAMIKDNADTFIEIGPGKVLSGLMRRIDKTKKVCNIEDSVSLEKTISFLNT